MCIADSPDSFKSVNDDAVYDKLSRLISQVDGTGRSLGPLRTLLSPANGTAIKVSAAHSSAAGFSK